MTKQVLLSLPLLILVACSAKEPENAQDNNQPANHEEDDHGEANVLAEIKLETFDRMIKIIQLGEIEAGKEGAVEVAFNTSKERISTVRAWIGVESGVGSMKGKMQIEGDTMMHGHIEVPDSIPAGSKLWLTFELDGKSETISLAYH